MRPRRRRNMTVAEPAGRRMSAAYEALARRWMLRLLVECGAHRTVLLPNYCDDTRMFEVLGIPVKGDYDPSALRTQVFEKHERAEARPLSIPSRGPLARNLAWLAAQLGLTAAETDILRFAILLEQHPLLSNTANALGHLNFQGVSYTLAKVLRQPEPAVRDALQRKGRLCKVGLLLFRERGLDRMEGKLALLEGFADQMLLPQRNLADVFSGLFGASPPSGLAADDYPHLQEPLRTAEAYLRSALDRRMVGVNILLYGVPGTGKTEFARMLAGRLGTSMQEIAVGEEDGAPFDGLRRLRAYQLSQAFLEAGERPLVLFDEAGDVLSLPGDELKENGLSRAGMKAWMNHALEHNPVPTVWVTNRIEACDPALLRRFDIVQEFKVPPRPVRERILAGAMGDLPLVADLQKRIVDHPNIPPAWVSRAVKVVKGASAVDPAVDTGTQLLRLLSEQLTALGEPGLSRSVAAGVELPYRLDCLQADCDLARIEEGLAARPRGRFCLYGPPGTGKTAFGRHLSEVLDRPLMVRRASDLLDKYVGGSEKRIAGMFSDAAFSSAVLLLDEADTFLRDRGGATHSWELSQVNEMLTQMEAFDGIFIASTNLMDAIDPAALRRFDLKIRFDFLKPESAWALFQETAGQLGVAADPALKEGLDRLRLLTPGDFATVLRRSGFAPVRDGAELLGALRDECSIKPLGRAKAIGF